MPSVKPYQIWQMPTYSRLRAIEAGRELLPDFGETRRRLAKPDHAERLSGFIDAMQLLSSATLTKEDGERLFSAAAKTLRSYSKRTDTRLATLHADLYRAYAKHLIPHDPWHAWWMFCLADPTDVPDHPEMKIGPSQLPEPLGELKDLRTNGLLLELISRCRERLDSAVGANFPQELVFEQILTTAQMSGNFQPLITLVRGENGPARGKQEAELALWLLAIRERTWVDLARRLARSNALIGNELAAPLLTISDLYEHQDSRISDRVESVGICVGTIAALPASQAMLGFGALARALFRTKQSALAMRVYGLYQKVSRAASNGLLHDGLLVTADIGEALELSLAHTRGGPPTSTGSRTVAYGQFTHMMISSLGYPGALKWIRRITQGPRKGSVFSEREMQATLANALGFLASMKGPILKLGQVVATYQPNLSPELSERLQQVPDLTSGIDPQTVVAVVERELGRPLAKVFTEFRLEPAGVGSIGQVHFARLLAGQPVAVKILFPDIETSIAYDLRILKTLTPVVKFLAPNLSFSKIVNTLAADFIAETDLRLEAQNQERMQAASATIPDLYIPNVYHNLTSRRLLVTDWVAGKKFEEFRTTSTAAERERAVRAIVRFVVGSCLRGTFNSDPNPGNFLFTENGVAAIDFGSVRVFSPTERQAWVDIIRACHTRDRVLLRHALITMGMVSDPKKFDFNAAFDSLIEGGLMTGTQEDKPVHVEIEQIHRDIIDLVSRKSHNSRSRDVPAAFIQGYRVYFGHAALVAQLGATVNFHRILKELLQEFG